MAEAEHKEAAAAAPKDGSDGTAVAAKSGVKRFLPYVAGGALSAGLGLTAAIVTAEKPPVPAMMHHDMAAPGQTPFDGLLEPKKVVLAPLVANLADSGQAPNGRFNFCIEIRAKDLESEMHVVDGCAKGAELSIAIRDALITLLSGKESSEIRTPRGKEILKLEILDKLKPILFADPASGTITGVFWDEFLVQ